MNIIKRLKVHYNLLHEATLLKKSSAQGSQRITGTEIDVRLGLNGSRSASYSYINGGLNRLDQTTLSVAAGLQTVKFQKYDISIGANPNYSFNNNSVMPQSNNNAASIYVNARGSVYLTGKLILSSDMNYRYTAKTQKIDAINMTILNASLAKTFLKQDKLKLTLSGNNLFNTNPTLNRSLTPTSITKSSFNTIMRYFLVGVSWDFTKFGTSAATN